tara:strand:- start:684 stop:2972 length:2289 start_codon:yes stop_codon:yes gene_type:complete
MAKRQQSSEFNPTQSIQPSQQITNQYITPSYFQMPQNEAIDVARSLSSLSPVLTELTGDLQRAMVETQVAEGVTALETASEEELDAALGMRWREAGLPEGASPIAQKAILAHAGKMKAKDALQKFRTENMDRFSDPMNTEDPREAMLAHFESLGISGFYASNAATEVYTKEANAFSEQVYQSRAARTATQNRENLENDLFELMAPFGSGENWTDQSTEEMLANMQGALDEAYQKFGFSGRDQLMNAITQAVQTVAKDDVTRATNLLTAVSEMKVGGQTVGKQFAFELDQLQDKAFDIRRGEMLEEEQTFAMQEKADKRISEPIIDEYIASQIQSGDLKLDQIDNDLRSKLEEAGVKNVNEAILEARKEAKTQLSLGNESDEETLIELDDIAASFAGGNPVMTQEQFKARISANKDNLSAADYRRYNQLANAFGNVREVSDDAIKRSRLEIRAAAEIIEQRLTSLALESGGEGDNGRLNTEAASRVLEEGVEHTREIERIAAAEAAAGLRSGLPQEKVDENIRRKVREYSDQVLKKYEEGLPADHELRFGFGGQTQVAPSVLGLPGTSLFTNDSAFAGIVSSFREVISGPLNEKRRAALRDIQASGHRRLQELIGNEKPTDTFFKPRAYYRIVDGEIGLVNRIVRPDGSVIETDPQISETALREYQAIRAIGTDPYTPEELALGEDNGGFDKRGAKIPESARDPRLTMYFRTMKSLQNAAEEYEAAEDKSNTYIGRLLVQMPAADFDSFLYSQAALLGYQGTK